MTESESDLVCSTGALPLHPRILSIGYGNRGFSEFVLIATSHQITHLVDVRSIPYSNYQVEFRRENLEHLLPKHRLRYVYLGDLLGAEAVRERPTDVALGIEKLRRAATPGRQICLLCGCLQPHQCHRGIALGKPLTELGIEYFHILGNGRLVAHQDLALQDSLF